MPATTYNYDYNGRLTSEFFEDGSRNIYNFDPLGNRIVTYAIPACCSPHYFLLEKTGNFEATDGSGSYYRITGPSEVQLPPSPGDGSVLKFKVLSGTATLIADGSEVINRALGVAQSELDITPRRGVAELISVDGGWDET